MQSVFGAIEQFGVVCFSVVPDLQNGLLNGGVGVLVPTVYFGHRGTGMGLGYGLWGLVEDREEVIGRGACGAWGGGSGAGADAGGDGGGGEGGGGGGDGGV